MSSKAFLGGGRIVLWLLRREAGVRNGRRVRGQEVNGPRPHRWPACGFLGVGGGLVLFLIAVRVGEQLPVLRGAPPSRPRKGSLRRDAAGNRIWKLSLGFLSACGGGHASV